MDDAECASTELTSGVYSSLAERQQRKEASCVCVSSNAHAERHAQVDE